MLVRDILEDEGVTSFAFADTQDAAFASAVSHPPDLMTSDVKLLSGTGPRAVDAIHKAVGEIPVIFITATPADCEPCEPPDKFCASRSMARSLQQRSARRYRSRA